MSDPWMKWYPSDWRSDPRLRMCSLSARGLWIELIGYMHEAEPYGYLIINDMGPDIDDVAALVGRPVAEVRKAMAELEKRGVYSASPEWSAIYSRRMVRDKAKADKDRQNGKGGGNPKLRLVVNEGVNPPDKAQIPEARDQIPEKKTRTAKVAVAHDEKFEEAWQAYPRRDGGNPKAPAAKRFLSAVKAGAEPQMIIDGVKRFAVAEVRNIGTPFIPQMVKWLNDQRWLDYGPNMPTTPQFDVRKHLI